MLADGRANPPAFQDPSTPRVVPCSRARRGRWRARRDSLSVPSLPVLSSSVRTATAAISVSGWCTVVSGGVLHTLSGMSSKPTTLRSSGTRRPASAPHAGRRERTGRSREDHGSGTRPGRTAPSPARTRSAPGSRPVSRSRCPPRGRPFPGRRGNRRGALGCTGVPEGR